MKKSTDKTKSQTRQVLTSIVGNGVSMTNKMRELERWVADPSCKERKVKRSFTQLSDNLLVGFETKL